jgi:predicted AlkP superfamily pyrophosphatase or phosphodiesterase
MPCYRIITIVLTLIYALTASVSSFAQKRIPPERPKLIIGIIVEQMNTDDLFKYWDKFENNGLKRLVNEGALCKNARYDFYNTQSLPGAATIATGCNPSVHGIVADFWPDIESGTVIPACGNGNYKSTGNFSVNSPGSPANLLTATIGDELKLFSNGKSTIISISLNPGMSIILGGHAADAAYWFDYKTGCWISNSYFLDSLPDWVNKFNAKGLASVYTGKEWKSLLPVSEYNESVNISNAGNSGDQGYFSYLLKSPKDKVQSYGILAETPFGDNLVKDFAIDAIVSETLGKHAYPDIIFITFSSTFQISNKFGRLSAELEDCYLRLDREIAHLLQFLDENIGKENLVLYLTSCHGSPNDAELLKKNNIPSSDFDVDKAMVLLKAYLNAIYRPGDWVKKYYNCQIFLKHNLIEDSKIQIDVFRKNVAEFMNQFSGVAAAITADYGAKGLTTASDLEKVRNNNYRKRCGDVFVILEPGWYEKNGRPEGAKTVNCPFVPLIWYGWKLNRTMVNRRVSITDIVPTLANFLNIRRPEGCTGEPITELSE